MPREMSPEEQEQFDAASIRIGMDALDEAAKAHEQYQQLERELEQLRIRIPEFYQYEALRSRAKEAERLFEEKARAASLFMMPLLERVRGEGEKS